MISGYDIDGQLRYEAYTVVLDLMREKKVPLNPDLASRLFYSTLSKSGIDVDVRGQNVTLTLKGNEDVRIPILETKIGLGLQVHTRFSDEAYFNTCETVLADLYKGFPDIRVRIEESKKLFSDALIGEVKTSLDNIFAFNYTAKSDAFAKAKDDINPSFYLKALSDENQSIRAMTVIELHNYIESESFAEIECDRMPTTRTFQEYFCYIYMSHVIKWFSLETSPEWSSFDELKQLSIRFGLEKLVCRSLTNQEEIDYQHKLGLVPPEYS